MRLAYPADSDSLAVAFDSGKTCGSENSGRKVRFFLPSPPYNCPPFH